MKVEVGKFYRNRIGERVSVVRIRDFVSGKIAELSNGRDVWANSGTRMPTEPPYFKEDDIDIVGPWPEHEFKVGDIVRRVTASDWPQFYGEVGKEYEVLAIRPGGICIYTGFPGSPEFADCYYFDLVTPVEQRDPKPNNVVTVRTVKQINDGIFNQVGVDVENGALAGISVDLIVNPTIDQLKAIVSVFEQLIDALESNNVS